MRNKQLQNIVLLLLLFLLLISCNKKNETINKTDFAIGTVCSITLYDNTKESALSDAFKQLSYIEETMSANNDSSYVALINENAGNLPVTVPKDLIDLAKQAEYFSILSEKFSDYPAFNPCIGTLVKLWNIGMEGQRVPTQNEIDEALKHVDNNSLVIDENSSTIFLKEKDIKLDYGAIAKGFAAEKCCESLKANGVKTALIDLGGNVKVIGRKPNNTDWMIGIQNPFDSRGTRFGTVKLPGEASIVTSGIYERYFISEDGKQYHHILDSKTGYPVDNGLASVTIITKSSTQADALSTTLFALGLEKGLELANSLQDVEAIFVDKEKNVYYSNGVPQFFTLEDTSFKVCK